jgi:DNA-binding MarR family transcriptional regulator
MYRDTIHFVMSTAFLELEEISETLPVPSSSSPVMTDEQYRRLADFRYHLRRFLHFSQQAAAGAGLHPQQYQLLQVVAGMPEDKSPTIAAVAARMCLRHNSVVELVNRTIEERLLRKVADPLDHRRLLLQITPAGERLLGSLTEYHLRELDELGPELIKALKKVLSLRQERRSVDMAGAAD